MFEHISKDHLLELAQEGLSKVTLLDMTTYTLYGDVYLDYDWATNEVFAVVDDDGYGEAVYKSDKDYEQGWIAFEMSI